MYLEIDEGFTTHRKTLRFCGIMQDHNAFAYLLRLWTWATRSAPDGELAGLEAMDIEIAVQYRGDIGKCYAAMVKAGFVEEDDPGKPARIHNWMKRTGATVKRFADDSLRKKLKRLHNAGRCAGPGECPHCDRETGEGLIEDEDRTREGMSAEVPADIPRTNTGKIDTVQTSPDQSRPVQTSEGDPERPRNGSNELPPPRPHRKPYAAFMASTPAFMAVYSAYPRKDARTKAAATFQELAWNFEGGEEALSKTILAWFATGVLRRHPYAGEDRFRPLLETVIAERRWEDGQSAPDDDDGPRRGGPKELPYA